MYQIHIPFDIILASASPRRKQLMEEAGYSFRVEVYPTSERIEADWPLYEVAERLAKLKAIEAMRHIKSEKEAIILAADTTVICNNTILNKPRSHNEARMMLQALSGRTHHVVSGVSIEGAHSILFHDITEVEFDHLSDNEIDFYIERYQPYDKAGAYGIQQWIGHNKVKRLNGSYTNVMGLPMHKLYQAFELLFGKVVR